MNGIIDDVRIFRYALTEEQIYKMYEEGSQYRNVTVSQRKYTIVSKETRDGDQWQTHITPFSSSGTGQTYKSNILVIGDCGAIETPITTKNKTSSLVLESGKDLPSYDLLCTYYLADSNTPVNTPLATTWYKNGSPLMVLFFPYFPMEGDAACALKDYSGNNNDGEKGQGGIWDAASGHDGNGAFRFNGEEDAYISFGNIMPLGSYTKTAWIKMDSSHETGNIISGR